MKYLLDTDTCIYLIKKRPASVISKLNALPNDQVALSAITAFELQFGVENSQQHKKSQIALNHFLEPFLYILPIDRRVAECAAKIRSDLKKKGTPIDSYDVLIAGVALAHELILVSNNIDEFQRVSDLKLENWVDA